jgi:hypothetical protein
MSGLVNDCLLLYCSYCDEDPVIVNIYGGFVIVVRTLIEIQFLFCI